MLRDPAGSIELVKRARQTLKQAPDGVSRERARLKVAEAYAKLADDYARLARSYRGAQRKDAESKAPAFARQAIKFLRRQRETLEDGGDDAYGKAAVRSMGLAERIAELEAEFR